MSSPERPRSTEESVFHHCPRCAAVLERRAEGARLRPTCPRCGFVQWRNPVVGVAGIVWESAVVNLLGLAAVRRSLRNPTWEPHPVGRRVLLVRRSASRRGRWCIPCGYVEFDEEIREALVREMKEETGLEIRPGRVLAVHSNFHEPDRQSVGIWFEATPVGGTLRPGDDADEIVFVDPGVTAVPLAFPTDAVVLLDLAHRRESESP